MKVYKVIENFFYLIVGIVLLLSKLLFWFILFIFLIAVF